jgi:hypothetical protein
MLHEAGKIKILLAPIAEQSYYLSYPVLQIPGNYHDLS